MVLVHPQLQASLFSIASPLQHLAGRTGNRHGPSAMRHFGQVATEVPRFPVATMWSAGVLQSPGLEVNAARTGAGFAVFWEEEGVLSRSL